MFRLANAFKPVNGFFDKKSYFFASFEFKISRVYD